MMVLSNIARSPGDPKVIRTGPRSLDGTDRLAKGLGWFSLALGATELLAAGPLTRALGFEGKEALVRAYGLREIASGVLTLSPDKAAGLWSRVAGDAVDLATLAPGLRADNPKRGAVVLAMAAVAGITALDVAAATAASARHRRSRGQARLYPDRSGYPNGIGAAHGAARAVARQPGLEADLPWPKKASATG